MTDSPCAHEDANRQEAGSPGFSRLLDALPGIVFIAEPRPGWPMKFLSDGCVPLTGYQPSDLIGREEFSYGRLTHPDDFHRVLRVIDDAVARGEPYSVEYRIRTRAGEEKWVWEKGHGVYVPPGEIISLEGFITDITPLKQTEHQLMLAKRKYQDIFEHAQEGIFQTSADGTYLSLNPALAHLYGYRTPTEMMSSLTDIKGQLYVDPTRRTDFVRLLEQRGAVRSFEAEVRRADGSIIWISENARAVKDAHGALLYYEGSVVDITARKHAEELLAKERNMLRTLIDHWPDIIYVRNREGRYLLSNAAHTRSLAMTMPAEVEGRHTSDFFLPARAQSFANEDEQLMERGDSILNRQEVRNPGTPGEMWVSTTKLLLRDPAGEILGLVGITRDISEQKRLEEHLRHSQKMEAVGTLAGGVAHDFNNILTAILGYSEMILAYPDADPALRHDAEEIHAGGLRAAALTQQLLAFSRKQISAPRALNVNALLEKLQNMLRRLIGENIQLQCLFDPVAGAVEADAGQIEQVVTNLVVNACDAMPHGGKLVLETTNVFLDEGYTREHSDLKAGPYVRLAVRDTGTGIDPAIRGRIFEPFFTTKEQGKGTGLGLATSYGIVTQSGGHIDLESNPGGGVTFYVFLPVGGTPQPDVPEPDAEIPKGSETVLLVEDEVAVRRFGKRLLDQLGYKVLEAGCGDEALGLVDSQEPHSIDLLVTDVVMPRMSGKRLAENMAMLSPRTKILFTSGYNEEAVLRQGIMKGEVAFLQKPYSPMEFARKVREVLDHESLPRPSDPHRSEVTA